MPLRQVTHPLRKVVGVNRPRRLVLSAAGSIMAQLSRVWAGSADVREVLGPLSVQATR